MPALWTYGRGHLVDQAIERHRMVWRLQGCTDEMLEWTARTDVGGPGLKEITVMARRELAWRQVGRDTPFR